jgi:hypothetical protein
MLPCSCPPAFVLFQLPEYSTIDILYAKLLYAITNCVAIDADSTTAAEQAGRMTGAMIDSDEEDD